MFKSEPTVLCVNESLEQLELFEVQFRQAGYRVLCAMDGVEAFEVARRERPDLIVSDVLMTRGGGVELCRAVRGDADLCDTPVMLVGALCNDDESVVEGMPGADEYLEAPYSSLRLIALAARLVERKRAGDALRESEERYRRLVAAVEQTADSIIITDTTGTIQYVNPAFERTSGYTKEEALGKNPRMLKSGKQDESVYREMWAALKRGEVWAGHFVNRHKDRSLYEEGVTISPVRDAGGEVISYIAVKQDLTQQKQLEEQLLQSQKMEAVGRLAGGVAHDFNNLLVVINGYSELTMRRLREGDPLRRNVEEIKKAGERAAALTRQLLAFSRKQVLQPKVFNINAVVSEMEKMLRRLIGEDMEFRTALASDLGSIKADPSQIEQVLLNLCVNARDAMPGGGKLTIETSNVYLDEEYASRHVGVGSGDYVMLAVSDTGCGMNDETLAHIFEPFFTTKEMGKGTGLGLSTVYGIVQQSGGSVWVYSEVGRGTTFKVYLPRVGEDAREYRRSASPEESARGTETILLAEDDELVRRLAREVLEMYGYRVLEAANGGAALLICERHAGPIDLLVTDAIMPEMSGRELSERLSSLRPRMKVLYMSGYADTAVVQQGVLDEWANFIQKPFTPDALTRKVREILDAPPAGD